MATVKRISYAALLAGAIAGGVLTTSSEASARSSSSLSYVVHNAGIAYLTKTGLTRSFPGRLQTGDEIFTRDLLFQGSTKVGYDNENCTVTFDNNDVCRVLAVFTGKGDVESTWIWIGRNSSQLGPSHFSGIIVGGTGAFERARGQFDASALPDGTLRITAHLG